MNKMAKKKQKSEITREYEYLKVDGRYFKPQMEGERVRYIQTTKKEFNYNVALMRKIVEKLKDSLDKEAVLLEALSKLDSSYLERLWGVLNNPIKKVKPRTRKHHCVDMKVGKLVIPIIN